MTHRRSLLAGLAALALVCGFQVPAHAQSELQQIKSKGVLTVGVKADYPPFGFRKPDGTISGIEPDLARDLAKRLGVQVALVPVVASNRIQFLQQGRIDVLIATMTNTPERAKLIQFVPPNYYASGYNLMLPKAMNLTSWAQMKGKPVCDVTGSYYNRQASEKFGIGLVGFTGVTEALTAMQQGRCVGLLFDDTAIIGQIGKPQWSSYDMPLPSQDAQPWGIAVKQGAMALEGQVHDAIIAWNKDGTIIQLESTYGITHHSAFAEKAHEQAAH
jgi:polar amino acid transport system substrate-binding protein